MLEKENIKEMENAQVTNSWDHAFQNEAWTAPAVDIYEDKDNYYLTASMPGVSKENTKIKIDNNNLIIMGRIDFSDSVKRKYILKETETANYYRTFKVSESIDTTKLDAKFENGLLHVTLPKHEWVKPRVIDIK